MIKRRQPTEHPLIDSDLMVENFVALQSSADSYLRHHHGFALEDRKRVARHPVDKDCCFSTGTGFLAGETDIVSLIGYVVGTPHAARMESETCNCILAADNNWLINIGDLPTDTEFDSVVTIMPPWYRARKGSTMAQLRWVAQKHFMVRVTGQLFYDSKHFVNNNPATPLTGEPPRTSLWEIHPITNFEVCRNAMAESCRESGIRWEPLEKIEPLWQNESSSSD